MAEIAGIHNDLYVGVFGRDHLEYGDGRVARMVVDEDVLVLVSRNAGHHRPHLVVQVEDVGLLVVTGRDDGDGLLLTHSAETPETEAKASTSLADKGKGACFRRRHGRGS